MLTAQFASFEIKINVKEKGHIVFDWVQVGQDETN
jgi:hypothetical protein